MRTNLPNGNVLQITNTLGQVIGTYPVNESEVKTSTGSWSEGVYYVSLMVDGKKVETIKIVMN